MITDLTHSIHKGISMYPGSMSPLIHRKFTIEDDGFRECNMQMSSHTGTHIDSPAHMIEDGKYLDDFTVEKFIGKAIVINLSTINREDITIDDINKYEKDLQEVDFVLFNTAWDKYWNSSRYYKGYPCLTTEAAEYIASFKLKGVGVDTISVDKIDSKQYDVHNILLQHNLVIIENLTNLNKITGDKFTFSALPISFDHSDGSPVRAVAIEE